LTPKSIKYGNSSPRISLQNQPTNTPPPQLFAQNLSLFTKLFIETKSVCFDVNSFLFYLLVVTNPASPTTTTNTTINNENNTRQIVGFFSKEKLSWDNNNLACILTFPPYQRRGYSQILMGASYEISKREGEPGGPEKRTSLYPNAFPVAMHQNMSGTY